MSSPSQRHAAAHSNAAETAIVLHGISFDWPDGSTALAGVSGSFTIGRTGLIGANGSGKSTLLRIIAGELSPDSGTVETTGEVAYLPQSIGWRGDLTAAQVLGISDKLAALRRIEDGDGQVQDFEILDDDWDVEATAARSLALAGLPPEALERRMDQLSGGEATLLAVIARKLTAAPITLLDEPSNNLDAEARARLGALVDDWAGTLVITSHDLELLDRMKSTAELYDGGLHVFGGNASEYRAHLAAEQEAAAQAVRTAEAQLRKEKQQRIEAEVKLARRVRTGKKAYAEKREPKIIMGLRKREAQVSAGKLRGLHEDRTDSARGALDEARERLRDDAAVRLALPDPQVPASRRLAELELDDGTALVIQGPERIALTGPNGIGKTQLLESLVKGTPMPAAPLTEEEGNDGETSEGRRIIGTRLLTDRIGYLPQRLGILDDDRSAIENVGSGAPAATPAEIRAALAQFRLRGDAALRPVVALSGGERFRVALARLLLASPPPQLLILDEPSNNLDLDTVDQLVSALRAHRGALLVVSHDARFLQRLELDGRWELLDHARIRQR